MVWLALAEAGLGRVGFGSAGLPRPDRRWLGLAGLSVPLRVAWPRPGWLGSLHLGSPCLARLRLSVLFRLARPGPGLVCLVRPASCGLTRSGLSDPLRVAWPCPVEPGPVRLSPPDLLRVAWPRPSGSARTRPPRLGLSVLPLLARVASSGLAALLRVAARCGVRGVPCPRRVASRRVVSPRVGVAPPAHPLRLASSRSALSGLRCEVRWAGVAS